MDIAQRILYEDNHYLAICKQVGELVQGDETGDTPLLETARSFIKRRDSKPGNVFLQAVHRLDRPVSGVVLFAKTSKGLTRANGLFRQQAVTRTYWAIVEHQPPELQGVLEGYLTRRQGPNKSYVSPHQRGDAKLARLEYRLVGESQRYYFLEVSLLTGRHHQIRAQLASVGCTIRGDLKYGAKRSIPGGGIGLHARALAFEHPIAHNEVNIVAPPPDDALWRLFPR